MAVRPFCIEADIEGRETKLTGGTRFKDGYQEITIYQRNEGAIETPYRIIQRSFYTPNPNKEHKLATEVYFKDSLIHTYTTDY